MARKVAASRKAAGNGRLKIFISYSRQDATAADAIVVALTERGFDVTIDTRDLPFGEKWQAELAEFIRLADTVIWLVSEASIKSHWVNWELDEVARRSKRLVPLMVRFVNPAELPRQLGEIYILPPNRVFNVSSDLDTVVEVLETDHAWLKQASRLQDRAHEWLTKSRASALLLSRGALADAERWKDRRPAKAPAPAQEVMDLLLASRQAANRWQRRVVAGSVAAAAVAMGLAGFAYLQSIEAGRQRDAAVRQEHIATEQTHAALTNQSQFLSDLSRQRLEAGDGTAAIEIALAALPDEAQQKPRPLVKAAQAALYRALEERRELSFTPTVPLPGNFQSYVPSLDKRSLTVLKRTPEGLWPEVWSTQDLRRLAALPVHAGQVEIKYLRGSKSVLTLERKRQTYDSEESGRLVADWPDAPREGRLRIFDVATSRELLRLEDVVSLDMANDGTQFLTLQTGGKATLWDSAGRKPVRSFAVATSATFLRFGTKNKFAVAFVPKEGGDSNEPSYIDLATGKAAQASEEPDIDNHVSENDKLQSPDGSRTVTGRTYKNNLIIKLFKAGKAEPLAILEPGGAAGKFDAAFSQDSARLVTTGSAHTAKIWDARSGKLIVVLKGHTGPIGTVAFSRDGSRVLTTSDDGTIRIWEAETGATLTMLGRHFDPIEKAFLSQDGRTVLSVGSASLRQWRVEPIPDQVFRFEPELELKAVSASQDGRRMLLVGEDGSLRVLAAGKPEVKISLKNERTAKGTPCLEPVRAAGTTGVFAGEERKQQFWFSNDGSVVVLGYGAGQDHEAPVVPRCAWRSDSGAAASVPPQRLSNDREDDGDDAGPTNFEQDRARREQLTIVFSDEGRPLIYDLESNRVNAEITGLKLPIQKVRTHQRKVLAVLDGAGRLHGIDGVTGRTRFSILEQGRKIEDFDFADDGAALFVQTDDLGDVLEPEPQLALHETGQGVQRSAISIRNYAPLLVIERGAVTKLSPPGSKEEVRENQDQIFVDARSGAQTPIAIWVDAARTRDVDRAGGHIFRTTGYRKSLDGFSRVLSPASGTELAAIKSHIISDGRIYQGGRRAWTRAGKGSWGRLLDIPVTIWDLEKRTPIAEISGETGVAALEPGDSVLQIRHYTGHFERRDADRGYLLYRTNPASLSIVRAVQLHRSGATMLLVASRAKLGVAKEGSGDKESNVVKEVVVLPAAANDAPRVAEAREAIPRCLTERERAENFLPAIPPRWCITGPGLERETDTSKWQPKWPYVTSAWRDWLIARDRGESPPLPTTE